MKYYEVRAPLLAFASFSFSCSSQTPKQAKRCNPSARRWVGWDGILSFYCSACEFKWAIGAQCQTQEGTSAITSAFTTFPFWLQLLLNALRALEQFVVSAALSKGQVLRCYSGGLLLIFYVPHVVAIAPKQSNCQTKWKMWQVWAIAIYHKVSRCKRL